MKLAIKQINQYLLTLLGGDEAWKPYLNPPPGDSNYILISQPQNLENGTKDEFITDGRVSVMLVQKTKGTTSSGLALVDKLQDVVTKLKPTPAHLPPVSGVFVWEIESVNTPIESFRDGLKIQMQICTVEYKIH
jgi:hypothetical protein